MYRLAVRYLPVAPVLPLVGPSTGWPPSLDVTVSSITRLEPTMSLVPGVTDCWDTTPTGQELLLFSCFVDEPFFSTFPFRPIVFSASIASSGDMPVTLGTVIMSGAALSVLAHDVVWLSKSNGTFGVEARFLAMKSLVVCIAASAYGPFHVPRQ